MVAQEQLGTWQDQLPYNKTIAVDKWKSRVYCATPQGVFFFDEDDNSVNRLSRVNALSDLDLSTIKVHQPSGTLVVAYRNGNIDLVKQDRTVNIPFIKNSTNIVGSKLIKEVCIHGNMAYLATGFGVVAIDLLNEEIKDTYYPSTVAASKDVNSVTVFGDTIWAATENSVFKAFVNNPFLSDPSVWQKVTSLPDSIEDKPYMCLAWFNNQLHATYDHPQYGKDVSLRYGVNGWEVLPSSQGLEVMQVSARVDNLLLVHATGAKLYDLTGNAVDVYYTYDGTNAPNPIGGILDPEFSYLKWIADDRLGLVRWQGGFLAEFHQPSGPHSIGAFDMAVADGHLWVVPGNGWAPSFVRAGISWYTEGVWKELSYLNNALLDTGAFYDLISVAVNPEKPTEAFIGSHAYGGLLQVTDGVIANIYTAANSSLQERIDWPGVYLTSALRFDKDGNLWVLNARAQNQLSVKTPDGTWYSYFLGTEVSGKLVTDFIIDKNGYKWILCPGTGILVFNDNGTLDDVSDDQRRFLGTQQNNGGLHDNTLNSIAADLEGEIWVGSNAGISLLFSAPSLFTGQAVNAQRILLEQDGYIQILLENDAVTSIVIDAGNRKWIGTNGGGLFLMDKTGRTQIHAFNTENSPLFSNVINSLAWDEKSGALFVGTDKGLLSYKTDATKPSNGFVNMYAYPNPVKPDYQGPVAIKGLARDSYVKITDAAGNLVSEVRSNGGLATWDVRTQSGERVRTGVYIVFATDASGETGEITKILVISE